MFYFVLAFIQQVRFRLQVPACLEGSGSSVSLVFTAFCSADWVWLSCAPPCSQSGSGHWSTLQLMPKVFGRLLNVRTMCSLEVSPGVLYNFVQFLSWTPFVILLAFSGSLVLPFQSSSQEVKALCFSFLPCTSCSCICVQDHISGGQRGKEAMVENRLMDMAAAGWGEGQVEREWGGMNRENSMDIYTPSYIQYIASGKLLCSSGVSAQCSVMT